MLFKEIIELEDNCKDECPLYPEFCTGGMACYGGDPVEPYCVSIGIEDDQDMDELYDSLFLRRVDDEKRRDLLEKKEKELAEKKKKAQEKRRATNLLLWYENKIIRKLKKSRKSYLELRMWQQAKDNTNAIWNRHEIPTPKNYFSEEIEQIDTLIRETEKIKKEKLIERGKNEKKN